MSQKVRLTQEQIDFIIKQTGIPTKNEAIEYFASLMIAERIDPIRIGTYVTKMMQRIGSKK